MRKNGSPSEAALIADQLHRAFYGEAWHGPALVELLEDIDARTAAARPLADVHSIWELVLHISAWDGAGLKRLGGHKCQLKARQNFPPVPEPTEIEWKQAVKHTRETHDLLVETVKGDFRVSASATKFPGKSTTSITCCMALRSTSSITPGRSRF